MKFKTSAIALAVAGTVATPMAAQADLYASARVGVEHYDTGGVADLRVRSMASRFGVRSETDLGNGMTGFGRYEWDVDFNLDTGEDDVGLRHRYVGLKGDFGSVTIGQTYHTFYNHVVGPNDNPWWGSGYAMVDYRGRTGNAVTYAGGSDAVTFGATAYMFREAEEDAIDLYELGLSIGIGDMTLGLAAAGVANDTFGQGSYGTDDPILAVALTGIGGGDFSMGVGLQAQEDDMSALANINIGNFYVHIEMLMADATSGASISGDDEDKTLINLGYTQSLGRKTTAYYELMQYDADSGNSDDDIVAARAILKYDIE